MKRSISALVAGALFGAGLIVSGMGQPQKIVGFLDFTGNWDPSVAFMFFGTVPLYALAYRYSQRRAQPVLGGVFPKFTKLTIDRRLLLAAVIFGLGWGLGGYCPGPGLVGAITGQKSGLYFLAGMLGGMVVFRVVESRRQPVPVDETGRTEAARA